jgi:hypothetical protein
MTVDTAATLAVLTMPVLAAVIAARAVARHNYLRRALTVQKNRREWARAEWQTARTEWRAARSRYRRSRRQAIADKYRTDRAARRERRDIRRMHRAYHMHRRKYRIR